MTTPLEEDATLATKPYFPDFPAMPELGNPLSLGDFIPNQILLFEWYQEIADSYWMWLGEVSVPQFCAHGGLLFIAGFLVVRGVRRIRG